MVTSQGMCAEKLEILMEFNAEWGTIINESKDGMFLISSKIELNV